MGRLRIKWPPRKNSPTFLHNLLLTERRGVNDLAPLPDIGQRAASQDEFDDSPDESLGEPFSAPPIVDNLKQRKIFNFEPIVVPNTISDEPCILLSSKESTPRNVSKIEQSHDTESHDTPSSFDSSGTGDSGYPEKRASSPLDSNGTSDSGYPEKRTLSPLDSNVLESKSNQINKKQFMREISVDTMPVTPEYSHCQYESHSRTSDRTINRSNISSAVRSVSSFIAQTFFSIFYNRLHMAKLSLKMDILW